MMDFRTNTRRRFGALGAVAAALPFAVAAVGHANAAENLRLTIISGNTHHYAPIGAAIKAFIPKVDEILAKSGKYKVSWVQGFGGQVVKVRGELDGVEAGLGDIGVVPGPFHPDKLSLYQIGYVTPFTSLDATVTTAGMTELMQKFPAMVKQGQRFNQTILAVTATADNYELWTKQPITRIEDLKGVKIGAVGSNIPWVSAVGATPVVLKGLATTYNSLKTGIYDGVVLWQQAMAAFKFCEIAKYKLATGFGAISNALLTVNMESWSKMPGEVQDAVKQAAAAWTPAADKMVIGGGKWGLGVCDKNYAQKTHVLTTAEKRNWAFALPNVARQWAQRQDKAGLPGSKMLSAWMDYMRDHKQSVVRHWDRE